MNSIHRPLILALLIAIPGLTACKKTSAPNETASTNDSASQSQQAHGGVTPQGQTKLFKGSIGNTLDLQMKLLREGDRLTGSYFYQKVGAKIDLRGSIDKAGNVTLEEFDASGKQTGVFQGTWKTAETGVVAIEGNWKAPNSSKQTGFFLREEPIEFSSGVEVVARRIAENNKKLKYEVDAEYPQLTGSGSPNYEKFNQTIRELVTKKVSQFKADMAETAEDPSLAPPPESPGSDLHIGYNIELAKDDLISVLLIVGSYSAGAAHPNSYSEVVNFDLRNGKLIKLSDLFKPGSNYLQTIAAYCIADLKKQGMKQGEESMLDDDWIQRGAGADAENYGSVTIGKQGLGITFDAYQVAPYAAGPQHVFVPYSALKDIIKADGGLVSLVK